MEATEAEEEVESGSQHQPVVDPRGEIAKDDGMYHVLKNLAHDVGDDHAEEVEGTGPEKPLEEIPDGGESVAELEEETADHQEDDQTNENQGAVQKEGIHVNSAQFAIE